MELLHAGVFNAWTEKSLGRLTELMPGRYAKHETSSGFLGAIDSTWTRRRSRRSPTRHRMTRFMEQPVTDEVRADYEAAVRMLEEEQYEPGIAVLLKVTEQAPALTARTSISASRTRAPATWTAPRPACTRRWS